MNTRFIGDIHGKPEWFKSIMTPNSIQVGDLDLYGYANWSFDDDNRFFIDGNHDNFSILNPDRINLQEINKGLHYIPRGYVSGKTLFIGGAISIDQRSRTPGHSWYYEEALTQRQFMKIMNIDQEIEVMVTHDCPALAFYFFNENKNSDLDQLTWPMRKALNEIADKFRPNLWIFGHHHINMDFTIDGCRFVCLAEGAYREFDIPIANLL